jgi:hypothetical protein
MKTLTRGETATAMVRDVPPSSAPCEGTDTGETVISIEQVLTMRVGCWRPPVHIEWPIPDRCDTPLSPRTHARDLYSGFTADSYRAVAPLRNSVVAEWS